jgi:hypothetical protein
VKGKFAQKAQSNGCSSQMSQELHCRSLCLWKSCAAPTQIFIRIVIVLGTSNKLQQQQVPQGATDQYSYSFLTDTKMMSKLTKSEFDDRFDFSHYGTLTDPESIPRELPPCMADFTEVVNNLGSTDGRHFRSLVDGLVQGKAQQHYIDLASSLAPIQKKQIYSLFTFITQKYVRCMGVASADNEAITEIPYEIGLIWHECAKYLGLPCVTSYAAVILYNCGLDSDNGIASRLAISGTKDELHFYKIHMKIEKIGGNVLYPLYDLDPASSSSTQQLVTVLTLINDSLKAITQILKKMYDECEPKVFWSTVRLYLGGYNKDSGLPDGLGVRDTELRFNFAGGSAAQSTFIQALDIVLGVKHEAEHGINFLLDQRKYMPAKHQEYLSLLESKYNAHPLKNAIMARGNEDLIYQYADTIDSLKLFRKCHYDLVHRYVIDFIKKPNTKNDRHNLHKDKGSGGLPTEVLEKFIHETKLAKPTNMQVFFSVWKPQWLWRGSWKPEYWLWPCASIGIIAWKILV